MRVVGSRLARWFECSCALALGLTALLAGCGTSDNIIYGTPVITMGDVSGDFTSYIVEIDEIEFTRNDGLVVEPLSTPEQVDLAKLTNMTELLEAPAFPYGTYTSMTLILDYTSPQITIDVNGQVQTVEPLDTTGAAMLSSTVTVNFDPQHPLVISPNQSTAFSIDIDLAAMNTVDTAANPITATVQPFVTASVVPVAQTGSMRARGLVVVAQPSLGNYIMNIRPFADLVSALGALQVNTSATTYFNINGVVYVGKPGLQAMNSPNVTNAPAVAYGTLDDLSGITPTFNATSVYVGDDEESVLADFVTGTVSVVSGDTLTLQGASYLNRYGELGYYGALNVSVGPGTLIYEDGIAASGLTLDSIGLYQQITVAGQTIYNPSTQAVESVDATPQDGFAGLVRLQSTQLWGTLNSATTGSMSLYLLSIDNFEPSDHLFPGTGSTSADDADAHAYRVDTGTLNESALPAGTLLQVNGLVTPLHTAPPDFTATSVVQGSTVPSTMVIEFGTNGAGKPNPFVVRNSSELLVNLSQADSVHYIATGPSKVQLTSLPAMPKITYASGTTLILAAGTATSVVSVYNEPASFADQLDDLLNHDQNLVYRIVCVGQYDAATNTFIATRVDVALEEVFAT
ncbi:MAG TPA: DUF4382 domain-containing protein [Steroidobacteraceae bacterium]|jgi:Domain of unknown function (DUF4382)|nr:DUF4382 domain-containing protein [Steroidobacteraceae bacterium]